MFAWQGALVWMSLLSLAMFFGSIVLVWQLIIRMPVDYLTRDHPPADGFRSQHPVIRGILIVTKNVVGLLLVIAGVIMLLTPGQGVLLILLGATLMDFPGKKQLVARLLGNRRVVAAINKIRERAQRPPLEIPSP